jgi:hypothetical protein
MIHVLLNYIRLHKDEILWAAVFAFFFWFVSDTWSPDSRLRAIGRVMKNKLAESSIKRLRKRIVALRKEQETMELYLTSDTSLYLAHFRILFRTIIWLSIGLALNIGFFFDLALSPIRLVVYALAGASAYGGLRFTALNTRDKMRAEYVKRGKEIEELETRLKNSQPKSVPPNSIREDSVLNS